MGYDGGFSKIRMKFNTQEQVNEYCEHTRDAISKLFKKENHEDFYKFESLAIDLPFLDNDWIQVYGFYWSPELIKQNFKLEEINFTLITKETLKEYIKGLNIYLETDDFKKRYNESGDTSPINWWIEEIKDDIKSLEKLYEEFDWDNDTLLFSYWY